jgi:hypothetical protein
LRVRDLDPAGAKRERQRHHVLDVINVGAVRTWGENSLLTSKLAKSAVSLHKKQPRRKSRTWQENSLLTSKLAKSTVSLYKKQPRRKSRTWQENSLLTSKSKRTVSLH